MRQKFDIGDLVRVTHPEGADGIILETKLINKNMLKPEDWLWHPEEYNCKVQFLHSSQASWVRAKWLKHLSKISE
jgi:hypothetical protein